MNNPQKKLIGFWGYPHPETILATRQKYPHHEFIDLDVDYKYPVSNILPDAYCKIIKNILDNSLYLKDSLELILAAVGAEKCDGARLTSIILKDLGFDVIDTRYENYDNQVVRTPISTSNLSLEAKINTIMNNVVNNHIGLQSTDDFVKSTPTHGFWGVPPNDFSILNLFPNTTHVFGWIRCVEAQRPADTELEMYVDENIPTVFFAQAFCSKMQIAKYLAKKYNGLYIDIDDVATNSVKAKVEAFIRLG